MGNRESDSDQDSGHLSQRARGEVTARLTKLLTTKGISGRELSRRTGIKRGTIANVLRGATDPTLGQLVRIAHALELRSVEELIAPLGTSLLREHEFGQSVIP